MKRLKLVSDWNHCWKWISIWCLSITGAISATWDTLPSAWQQILLTNASIGAVFRGIGIISVMGILGRLIEQGGGNGKSS